MKKYYIITLALSVFFLASCFKDKGNYDYTELAEITIENIPEVVEVLGSSDHIVINPKVTSSLEGEITADNPNFEFKYLIEYGSSGQGWLDDSGAWVVNLNPANTMNLDTLAAYEAGTYTGAFIVKDLRTGVETVKTFDIIVSSVTYEGWLVLCNEGEEERVRMDMISMISSDNYVTAYDVLSPLGLPKVHHATGIGFYPNMMNNPNDVIYIMSKEGTYRLDRETFETDESYSIYAVDFIVPPTDPNENIVEYTILDVGWEYYAGAAFCVSTTGNAYAQLFGTSGAAFEYPINTYERGGDPEFRVAPYVGVSMVRVGNGESALFYDIDNQRFVGWTYGSSADNRQRMFSLEGEDERYFPWSTGMDLVYMESTRYSNGLVYSVLEDASGHRGVYPVNMGGVGFVQATPYTNLNAPNFDKATAFAFHSQYPLMFYAAENKVYLCNLGTNQTTELTNVVLNAGEEVTLLKFNLYQQLDLTLLNNQSDEFMARQYELIVGTYDSSLGNDGGRLAFYKVNSSASTVEKRVEYDGFAKIVDVVYRERR